MSDFKAKIYQIRFQLGLCPRPRWGNYSAPPDPLVGFEGPTSKGGEGSEEEERGRRRRKEKGGKRGGEERREKMDRSLSGNVAEKAFCLESAPADRASAAHTIRRGHL